MKEGPVAGGGRPRRRRLLGPAGAAVATALLLAACGSSSAPLAPSAILRADPGTRTAELDLIAGETGTYGGFNFDGYSNGKMHVSVPQGWTIDVTCANASTTLANSCAVIEDRPLAPGPAPLAFLGASTADPTSGLGLRTTAHFHFLASRVGTYRIACIVESYDLDGMWDWLVVTRGGRPTVRT